MRLDGADPQFARRPDDAHRDLAAIGDEEGFQHGLALKFRELHPVFPFSRLREKVPEGRMRVSSRRRWYCATPSRHIAVGHCSLLAVTQERVRGLLPNTLIRPVGHLLPQAGEGESLAAPSFVLRNLSRISRFPPAAGR